MIVINFFTSFFLESSHALSVLLFLVSALLLVAGVVVNVWNEFFMLGLLEHRPLSWIEQTHPQFPSPRIALIVTLSCATLLVVIARSLGGVFNFEQPLQELNISSLFLLCAAVGMLADLKWRAVQQYLVSFLEGTAAAFLLHVLIEFSHEPLSEKGIVLLPLLASITLAEAASDRSRSLRAILVFIVSFAFWVMVWLVSGQGM